MDRFDMDLEELLDEQERRTGRSARGLADRLKRRQSTLIAGSALVIAVILLIVCVYMSFRTDDKPAEPSANMSHSVSSPAAGQSGEQQQEQYADSSVYSGLYMIDQGSGLYIYHGDGSIDLSYPTGTVSGLYTGKKNTAAEGTIEIDYQGKKAVVYSENVIKIENARTLPLGAVSQHTAWGGGESGCAAACLAMILGEDYETLLTEGEAYADQGSLDSLSGGMTFDAMAAFCKARSGRELKNAYTESELPSATVKRLIDEGRYAIVLVKMSDNYISADGIVNHFIVVNGYIEQDGEISFTYANSYLYDYGSGIALEHIDPDAIDSAANAVFDEPRTIAYIE